MSETTPESEANPKAKLWKAMNVQLVLNFVIIIGGMFAQVWRGFPGVITYLAFLMGVLFLTIGLFQPKLEHIIPQMDWLRSKHRKGWRIFYGVAGVIGLIAGTVGLVTLLLP